MHDFKNDNILVQNFSNLVIQFNPIGILEVVVLVYVLVLL